MADSPTQSSLLAGCRMLASLCFACFMLSGLSGLGQASQQIPFSYEDKKGVMQEGSFRVEYKLVSNGNSSPLPGGPIVFSGKGEEWIEIRFSQLSWTDLKFSGEVFVDYGDIVVADESILSFRKKQFVLKANSKSIKKVQFFPKASGSTSIDIAYRVAHGTSTARIIDIFSKSVNIQLGSGASTELTQAGDDPQPPPPPKAEGNDQEAEDQYWLEVVDEMSIPAFERYLQRYPNGQYASSAEGQIQRLKEQQAQAAAEAQAQRERESQRKPASNPPKSSSSKNPEQTLYEKIVQNRLPSDCETYLSTYPKGKYLAKVQEILEQESPIKILANTRKENTFFLRLAYVHGSPKHEILGAVGEEAYSNPSWNATTQTFSLTVSADQQLSIRFTDDRGPSKTSKDQILDTRFEPLLVSGFEVFLAEDGSLAADSVQFAVSGGQPPYMAEFIRMNETEATYRYTIGMQTGQQTLILPELLEEIKEENESALSGSFFLRFVDKRGAKGESVFKNQLDDVIRIAPQAPGLPMGWIIGGGSAFLLLVLLNLILRARKRARFRKLKEREAKNKERALAQHQVNIQRQENMGSITQTTETGSRVNPPKTSNLNNPGERNSSFKITKKQPSFRKITPKRSFAAQGDPDYLRFDLQTQWQHPAVKEIYMHQQCAKDIDQFIHQYNVEAFLEEKNDMIPEIGGFLLGTFELDSQDGQHRVSLEKFQPITAEAQDLYKVEFGVTAWAELADIQDLHEDLVTIGWFHTHPGHGLFLSQPDLRIHEGFFKQPYQLAMEIDTKSPDLDTAFFTRDVQGRIYNSRDRISSSWYRWKSYINNGQRIQ